MKCLSLFPFSNIIIAENMDVYEVYIDGKTTFAESPEPFSEEYFVRKLPMKANLDWDKTYGDDGTNNWCCDRLPWVKGPGNTLIWDY